MLVGGNCLSEPVTSPLRLIVQERAVNVVDGENEVIAPQFLLTPKKALQFITTGLTLEEARGDDGNKERDRVE